MTYGASSFVAAELARARAVTRMCDALLEATGCGVPVRVRPWRVARLADAIEACWGEEEWALLAAAGGVGWKVSEETRRLVVARLRMRGNVRLQVSDVNVQLDS